ncbi:MAG TPA: acetyl-CoA acetyltransferase [Desulfobacterales bacterium]|nr:acetyl-CoA acetyltransferase [Desulfobacterales bacterium]
MPSGIKDKVAIIGMGCTRFGERWDVGAEELMVEAFEECIEDAGIEPEEIQAAWLGSCMENVNIGRSALPLSSALRLPFIPVTRTENYCASGTEAFRGAVYAVASGAYDVCLALGVEKLKDTGYGGLPEGGSNRGSLIWLWHPNMTAPGAFAQLATAYAAKYRIPPNDLKRAMAQVSVKSHANGALNPKAHLRRPITIEQVVNAPIIAYPLGLFDCCGVSDGSACAIVTTVERAKDMGIQNPVTVKALQLALSNGEEMGYNEWDGTHFMTTDRCSTMAYKEAGITNPRQEISMMEVHDCFSITELVTCEDLHISERGEAWRDFLDGFYNRDGKIPCQVDGGLKCFGHPIGASGLRMLYEMYLQLLGRAEDRQLESPRYGLTHNLGGRPFQNICSICIIGRYKN